MIFCKRCGKKIPRSKKLCPYCHRPTRETIERRIPVVTAIIALVFLAVVIFGVTAVIIARVRDAAVSDGDVGLHLDGIWVTESPTFNDENITYVFNGDSFTSTTERLLFDADPEALSSFIYFYVTHHGATVDTEDVGDGNYNIRISTGGTFTLYGNSISLIKGESLRIMYSFYWDGEAIYIDGNRFVR